MSWGIIRILIAVGNWLADTCKHENWGAVSGVGINVRAGRHV